MSLYEEIFIKKERGRVLVLLDPDKLEEDRLQRVIANAETEPLIAGYLVGSSFLIRSEFEKFVISLKKMVRKPVILFPGGHSQVVPGVDGLLFLSLLSGRNPQYLIEEQVKMAPLARRYGLESIPTAYLLIESGSVTSVEFVTNTRPLPRKKLDIIESHALAAEYLGFKLIYLEAGSGAQEPVPPEAIKRVKERVGIPVIVGGGLNSVDKVRTALDAGADLVVVGNKIEEDPDFIRRIV